MYMTASLTEINLKHAELSDLEFIIDVYNQTIPSRMVTADITPITVKDRIDWFFAHNRTNRPLWIIEYNKIPCGWVSLSSFYGRAAYAKTVEISLYIDQQFRGKKIGQFTVSELEKFAQKHGIETILCYIFGHNQPSLALFSKMGYQQWGLLPNIAELDQIKRDLVILGKRI